jgi:hypothetical protein
MGEEKERPTLSRCGQLSQCVLSVFLRITQRYLVVWLGKDAWVRVGKERNHVICSIDAKTVSQKPESMRGVVLELERSRLVGNSLR